MTDPIADMLTRIRNAYAVQKESVSIPHSKVKASIANTLKAAGYIKDFKLEDADKPQPSIIITLIYIGKSPAITQINRVSKPGRRVYIKSKHIKPVLSGHGINIVSTPQGIMTGNQAIKQQVGGEILCEVW